MIESNSSGASNIRVGKSADSSEEIAEPTRTTLPISARAWGPTTLPRPTFIWPGPDSVLSMSLTSKARVPVRSSGPVIA